MTGVLFFLFGSLLARPPEEDVRNFSSHEAPSDKNQNNAEIVWSPGGGGIEGERIIPGMMAAMRKKSGKHKLTRIHKS